MSSTYHCQSFEQKNNNSRDCLPERRTPVEGLLSSLPQMDNGYSPLPAASMTSSSTSPGSTSMLGHNASNHPSVHSFHSSVSAFPSSSSFDATSNFQRVNSTVSSCSEAQLSLEGRNMGGGIALNLSPLRVASASHLAIFGSTGNDSCTSSPKKNGKPTVNRRRTSVTKARSKSSTAERGDDGTSHRRQKRLQRNRESARLSRRRRKAYLEVLEERVNKLSDELDKNRRAHVAKAVETIHRKSVDALVHFESQQKIPLELERILSRTSEEMMVATTFRTEQLKSFFVPPNQKFILWLTLQSDSYFRGGRAASERLSAARIGERMLTSGTDRATPGQQMWPLLCNEIGVSYDQEEKVRSFQKGVLQDQESWVDRHKILASERVLAVAHDVTQALTLRLGQRERASTSVLSAEQRAKLLCWSHRNRTRISRMTLTKTSDPLSSDTYKISKEQHVAANLYVLNHLMEKNLQLIPRAAPLIRGEGIKKLSIRPSFESLGAHEEKLPECSISRENSSASVGSLDRNESEMSMDSESKAPTQITPQEAQEVARPRVEEALGHVRPIIPSTLTITLALQNSSFVSPHLIQTPLSVNNGSLSGFSNVNSEASSVLPAPVSMMSMEHTQPNSFNNNETQHERKSSFLPANLNVVPEEMWPDETDELLMDLAEGDWAIGEGVDMDHL